MTPIEQIRGNCEYNRLEMQNCPFGKVCTRFSLFHFHGQIEMLGGLSTAMRKEARVSKGASIDFFPFNGDCSIR